jgi:hypothetical protein
VIAVAWAVWLITASLIVAAIASWIRKTGEWIAPYPIALATIGFYILPRAAYLLWFDRAPATSAVLLPDERLALMAKTVGLAGAAVLAFLLGHRALSAQRAGSTTRFALPDPAPDRALYIGVGALIAGAIVLYIVYLALGSISYALSHQYEIPKLIEGKQSFFQLSRLAVIGTMLLLVDLPRRRSRWWVWLLTLAFGVAFIPLGSRQYILFALGLPLGLYHLMVRRLPARWFFPAMCAGALILFSFSYLRLLGPDRLSKAATVFARTPSAAIHFAFNASGELKIFDAATIVVRDTPREISYNYGASFATVPWMIIPRRIWPEKPKTSGHLIIERYLPQLKTAWPPTALGDFFLAGGPVAVLLGFFAFGWLARFAWEWRSNHTGLGNTCLYLEFCAFTFDFTRVGDPSRTVWFFLIGASLLVVLFGFAAPVQWHQPLRVSEY